MLLRRYCRPYYPSSHLLHHLQKEVAQVELVLERELEVREVEVRVAEKPAVTQVELVLVLEVVLEVRVLVLEVEAEVAKNPLVQYR